MSIEGTLIVCVYREANYVMIPRDVTTRIVRGVEIVETRPGISFDFQPLGFVPMPMLQGAGMQRGVARGHLDVADAAKRSGLSETEVLEFFANHDDYGRLILAVDKKSWRVIPKTDLLAGHLTDTAHGDRVKIADNPDFEDRGVIDGKRMYYDRVCGELLPGTGVYGHSQGAKHKAAKAVWEREHPPTPPSMVPGDTDDPLPEDALPRAS